MRGGDCAFVPAAQDHRLPNVGSLQLAPYSGRGRTRECVLRQPTEYDVEVSAHEKGAGNMCSRPLLEDAVRSRLLFGRCERSATRAELLKSLFEQLLGFFLGATFLHVSEVRLVGLELRQRRRVRPVATGG